MSRKLYPELVYRGAQAVHQPCEQMLALGRGRAGRVAEHAVGADRAHAPLTQQRQNLCERPDVVSLGRVEPHRAWGQGEHDRGLRPAGMRVPFGQSGMPGQAGAAVVAEPPDGRLDRGDVPAVSVDHQQRGPVQAGVPAQLDQARGQRFGADGQRAREGSVFATRADRWTQPPIARLRTWLTRNLAATDRTTPAAKPTRSRG